MLHLHDVSSKYDALAEEYDKDYALEDAPPGWRFQVTLTDTLTWRYLQPYLPEDRSEPILDAGGGTGKWALRIAELGYRDVRILDLSPGMLAKAEERFAAAGFGDVLTVQEGDIRELPWQDGSFGMVLSEGDPVGYCQADYPKAISEMVRVCKPGCMIVSSADDGLGDLLGTLQQEGPEAVAEQERQGRVSADRYGLPNRSITPLEWQEAFRAAGAEVVKIISKPATLYMLQREFLKKVIGDPALEKAVIDSELWACEQGYICPTVHLQVIARKQG